MSDNPNIIPLVLALAISIFGAGVWAGLNIETRPTIYVFERDHPVRPILDNEIPPEDYNTITITLTEFNGSRPWNQRYYQVEYTLYYWVEYDSLHWTYRELRGPE